MLWRLRYKLSLYDLAEMFLERGFVFTHEAVREWEERFTPLLTQYLRADSVAKSVGGPFRPVPAGRDLAQLRHPLLACSPA